jgi:hypothetical protein
MNESGKQTTRQPVRLKVSPRVARIVAGQGNADEQLQAIRGQLDITDAERLTLLIYFGQNGDATLVGEVRRALAAFPADRLRILAGDADLHPRLVGFLAKRFAARHGLATILLSHPNLPEHLRGDLEALAARSQETSAPGAEQAGGSTDTDGDEDGHAEGEDSADEEIEVPGHLSKYQMTLQMGVAEKIKAAMTGDKEWRGLLINDSNKLVSAAVLKNPRITEGEVSTIARNKSTSEELIRLIMLNREWTKNYGIKLALVMHPRTPLGNALRFMGVLTEKDLKSLVKSREVSPVIVNNARRMLMSKSKRH